jgi:peptide methionine sulfoxide reductase MsrA
MERRWGLPEVGRTVMQADVTLRVRGISSFRADYHQQYLAKNWNGYFGIGGCGDPFKLAKLQIGEKT